MEKETEFNPQSFRTIPRDVLERTVKETVCACCGEPYSDKDPPRLASRCHPGPVTVQYWHNHIYISCYECGQPLGKVELL